MKSLGFLDSRDIFGGEGIPKSPLLILTIRFIDYAQ
jgi:hypothetical protein